MVVSHERLGGGSGNQISERRASRRLADRRCGQTDENHDAITTGIAAEVDIKIGLPIIERPNVASLVDHYIR